MRGRGLKQISLTNGGGGMEVAPHAGAWIETPIQAEDFIFEAVAPHAGAWIETIFLGS